MKKLPFAALTLLLAAASPASAQQQPIQLILNFDGPQLGEQLTAMGATWEPRTTETGAPFLSVTFGNGAKALAIKTVCNGEQPFTGCTGLRMVGIFTKNPQSNTATVARQVNEFNIGHPATMATYAESGDAQLNMYVIADNGIAIANLRVHLAVFQNSLAQFSRVLYPSPAAAPAGR